MPRHSSASLSVTSGPHAVTRLQPPPDLSEAERNVFVEATLSCRADHFLPSDSFLLAAYSRAVCLERRASEAITVNGPVTADGRTSPWLAVLAQSSKSLLALSRSLRLAPASRSSANPKRVGSVSYYERLMEGERETE